MNEGLSSFEDFKEIEEDDISTMASTMAKRTVADGRTLIRIGEVRKLKSLMFWIQDFYRCSDILDRRKLRMPALKEATERAKARQNFKKTESSALMPEKFTNDKQWDVFYKALKIYLASIPGIKGVPLFYVLRENELPQNGEFQTYTQRSIARAPLNGNNFENDVRQVHLIVTQLTAEGPGEQWIEHLAQQQNGRLDVLALVNQYADAGNYIRQMAMVQKFRDTLHYKSERIVPFSTFLQWLQKMFQIALEQEEPFTDRAKCRELLSRCAPCTHLTQTIAALKVEMTRGTLSYQATCNHLHAEVSANNASTSTFRNMAATTTTTTQGKRPTKDKPRYIKLKSIPWSKWKKCPSLRRNECPTIASNGRRRQESKLC